MSRISKTCGTRPSRTGWTSTGCAGWTWPACHLVVRIRSAPVRLARACGPCRGRGDEARFREQCFGEDVDLQRPPVPDQEVHAVRAEQFDRVALRALLAHEVDHCLRVVALVSSRTSATCEPSSRAWTVWSASQPRACSSAAGLRSTTMISVADIARRAWMPMCPSPPASRTTVREPGTVRSGDRAGPGGVQGAVRDDPSTTSNPRFPR